LSFLSSNIDAIYDTPPNMKKAKIGGRKKQGKTEKHGIRLMADDAECVVVEIEDDFPQHGGVAGANGRNDEVDDPGATDDERDSEGNSSEDDDNSSDDGDDDDLSDDERQLFLFHGTVPSSSPPGVSLAHPHNSIDRISASDSAQTSLPSQLPEKNRRITLDVCRSQDIVVIKPDLQSAPSIHFRADAASNDGKKYSLAIDRMTSSSCVVHSVMDDNAVVELCQKEMIRVSEDLLFFRFLGSRG
jgi:hypothetical protein